MANAKEIRTKIGSVKSTSKITSAMQMVSASKMAKAQARRDASFPYASKIFDVISHLARSHTEYRHPYLRQRDVSRIGLIVVSSDRGLCGGLNTNLFKKIVSEMKVWREDQIETELCMIGSKGFSFFSRFNANIIAKASQIGDAPTIDKLIGIVRVMLDAFEEGRIDAIYIAHNEFVNTMTQKPVVKKLLPIETNGHDELSHHWDYIYEPDAATVIEGLLTRFIEAQVFHAVVENIACEQAARMVAMKSATDNANDLIDELSLMYNKARQAAITQELSEIVAGAEAV